MYVGVCAWVCVCCVNTYIVQVNGDAGRKTLDEGLCVRRQAQHAGRDTRSVARCPFSGFGTRVLIICVTKMFCVDAARE